MLPSLGDNPLKSVSLRNKKHYRTHVLEPEGWKLSVIAVERMRANEVAFWFFNNEWGSRPVKTALYAISRSS